MSNSNTLSRNLYSETIGQGKTILLIHGIMSDHTFFDTLSAALSKDYRLILYDRLGYGQSKAEKDADFSVPAQLEDAVQVIKQHTEEPVYVIAHSAGGVIGLELAMKYPELVEGLILIETPAVVCAAGRDRLQKWNEELNEYAAQKKVIKAIPAFQREIGAGQKSQSQTGVTAAGLQKIYKNLNNFMKGELNAIQKYQPDMQDLKRIPCPVAMFLTTGKPDSIYTLTAKEAAEAANWEIGTLSGIHNVVEHEPEEFVEKANELLNRWIG